MINFSKCTPCFCAILAVLCVACGYNLFKPEEVVCKGRYALCTSARCIPDPENAQQTICFCDVYEGDSYGQESCSQRKPYIDTKGVEHLVSTYSFEQYAAKKTMTCPEGNQWSFCLDKPCTVDPADPKKAICSCSLMKSGTFVTLGGDCDKSTCKTARWSGASPQDTLGAMEVLRKAMGLEKAPSNYCPE